jgi:hypothetical protein
MVIITGKCNVSNNNHASSHEVSQNTAVFIFVAVETEILALRLVSRKKYTILDPPYFATKWTQLTYHKKPLKPI